jgi:hypothetical protein
MKLPPLVIEAIITLILNYYHLIEAIIKLILNYHHLSHGLIAPCSSRVPDNSPQVIGAHQITSPHLSNKLLVLSQTSIFLFFRVVDCVYNCIPDMIDLYAIS